MNTRFIRIAAGALMLSSLLVLGALRAQETAPPASPPPAAEPPADQTGDDAEGEEAAEEEVLPPGESLSADNNLSYPVDI